MKKHKKYIIPIIIIVVFIALAVLAESVFWREESPDGKYEIIGYLFDQGGFGYSGDFYFKEKGLLKKWHKLGDGPCACEWLSNEEFYIHHSNPIDGDVRNYSYDNYHRTYNVSEFLTK